MMRGRKYTIALGIVLLALSLACGNGQPIGGACQQATDCADGLQCFDSICAPQCEDDRECGDGYVCDRRRCIVVQSSVGDVCFRERDCAASQTCRLEAIDGNGDGLLDARCATQRTGSALGTRCSVDDDCRSGSCNIGRCTEVCRTPNDCDGMMTCTRLPRLASAGGLFLGCFQEGGTAAFDLAVDESQALGSLPVPGNARSFTLTTAVADLSLHAGVYLLATPSGEIWYETPSTTEAYLANPIRYSTAAGGSTMYAPNRPGMSLTAGSYPIRIGTSFPSGDPARELPTARVIYKLHDSAILDVNVYFLDLDEHPCAAQIGGVTLSADTAAALTGLNTFRGRLRAIFTAAGIEIDQFRYRDIETRPDLDGLDVSDLSELLALGDGDGGINLFFVRSIEPGGVQVISGGNPAPPQLPGQFPEQFPGQAVGGVAVSMDTLCYRDWRSTARLVAHSFGRQMGLFRNREPDSEIVDPIDDSESDTQNLMFFAEFGGDELSEGQASVLRHYPGLR